jgi:hypothetical protein
VESIALKLVLPKKFASVIHHRHVKKKIDRFRVFEVFTYLDNGVRTKFLKNFSAEGFMGTFDLFNCFSGAVPYNYRLLFFRESFVLKTFFWFDILPKNVSKITDKTLSENGIILGLSGTKKALKPY